MASTLQQPVTRAYRTVNPATGEVVREFDTATDEQAEALLARADEAFAIWRRTPIAERAARLRAFADLIDANTEELARLSTLEMGKPVAQSAMEAGIVSTMGRYYADHAEELLADVVTQVPGFSKMVTRREPMGVTLAIEPWNAPLYQAMRAAIPNLVLGNTVLVKPAEISAGSTLAFDDLFIEAGFPAGAYQTALVSTDQVSSYIADPRVRAVTLTGSDRAGSAVAEQAGRHVKPIVLELGGSDAFIVLDSADVTKAAGVAAACRLAYVGQVCVSPKRMIVTEAAADAFTEAFIEVYSAQTVGDPFDPATTVGPMASSTAADLLQAQYQDAIDKGATVLIAGGRVDGPGAYFQPALITDLTPDMRLYTEEAFGPLAMIYRVADAAAAVELANSSVYGLGGTVYGEDLEQAREVAGLLDTGMVGVNAYFGAPIEVPFGGTKRSGFGRELGATAMDQFANIKSYGIA